jgi:hypothetical protein
MFTILICKTPASAGIWNKHRIIFITLNNSMGRIMLVVFRRQAGYKTDEIWTDWTMLKNYELYKSQYLLVQQSDKGGPCVGCIARVEEINDS